MSQYSDYIVYVDESGDHGLQNLDPDYPIFVLAFCVFHKRHYSEFVVPSIERFKFDHFGHDIVILHEHEIRKEKGAFSVFKNRQEKNEFLSSLTQIIESSNFMLISCVIEKSKLQDRYRNPKNPYHIALGMGLERVFRLIEEKQQADKLTHIVVEQRGKKEDDELELEFRRICSGENWLKQSLPFEIQFADKRSNSSGLQFADLIARPVGLHVLRPEQKNRAFDVLRKKFYCKGGRQNIGDNYDGFGLKRFP